MSKKNRKKAEEFILTWMKKITRTEFNVNLYKDLFKRLTDKEFDKLMTDICNGEQMLHVIVPHDKNATNITVENNLKLGKELGFEFFQHLYKGPTETEPRRKTKFKVFNYLAPIRRTKQTIEKGLSVAENDKQIDLLTGQVTGNSKSSKISYPELQLLIGMGLEKSVIELIKYRGGDEGAMRTIKQALLKYGRVSSELIDAYSTGVISSQTLKAYFNSMHFKINLK